MAPTAPKKRPSMRSKSSKSTTSSTTSHSGSGLISRSSTTSNSFIHSKKDKRTIKSSSFLNRIEKSHTKPLKRRRPSKKLVTTLESLGDALPELEGLVRGEGKGGRKDEGKIRMDSLTSGSGLMRRRGKVEKVERERFGRNLALLMGSVVEGGKEKDMSTNTVVEGEKEIQQPSTTVKRFKALRAWIGETMEKDQAFVEKK